MTDIPDEMQDIAQGLTVGAYLSIELNDDDPAFMLDGNVLGWLADNIEEVTQCLQAGWLYRGEVLTNLDTSAGPVITTQVIGTVPPG